MAMFDLYSFFFGLFLNRCGTCCLLFVLSQYYPNYMILFMLITVVDVASHYAHMYSSLLLGKESHKDVDPNTLLGMYVVDLCFLECFLRRVIFFSIF